MNYIENVQNQKLTCTHPMVAKIWEYGGCASNLPNSEFIRYVCIGLKNGIIKQFKDTANGDAIKEAELYLQNLKY